jgi:integrase
MARIVGRLTARQVSNAKPKRGRDWALFPDGGNLYLQTTVAKGGHVRRSWLFKYEKFGERHELGLGPLSDRSLAEARDKARALRQGLRDGVDPLEAKQEAKRVALAARAEEAKAVTFKQCAERCASSHAAGWRSAKHGKQWLSSLEQHAFPVLGDLAVGDITTAHVVKALEPIWKTIPETASRVRGRIEKVLGWATVRGFRSGDNPAKWGGHLSELFPARGKVRKVKHFAAMPYADAPSFMADLRKRPGTAARALEFLILTSARSREVLDARFSEIDLKAKSWTVPAERMKSGEPHRVPLSPRAIDILREMETKRRGDFVFPGASGEAPLWDQSFALVLKQLGRGEFTVHGMRSAFRTWAAERTSFSREVCEHALAHVVAGKTEAAYWRGDLFEKRRKLMEAWATFCAKPAPAGATVLHEGARA